MSVHITRRDFLQATAGVGAVVSVGSPFAHAEANAAAAASQTSAAASPPLAGWFDRPMRWVQLALVENDPGRFDPEFWLDYFRRLHADAATLSAGGIVAFYPTQIPLHHRSTSLGDSDPFGVLVSGCRKLGMHILAYRSACRARRGARGAP